MCPPHLLTRNAMLRPCTRAVYDVVHSMPPHPSPRRSGRPVGTVEAAQRHAKRLEQHGYAGWIRRVQEYRQEDWPAAQWLIDHEQAEPMVGMHPFERLTARHAIPRAAALQR